jgi:DNA polymerase III epsilon subunit-like protein
LCDYEFFGLLLKCVRTVDIQHLDKNSRLFTLLKAKKPQHYGRLNVTFIDQVPMPDSTLKEEKIERDRVMLLLNQANQKSKSYKLRQNQDVVQRTTADILCPICARSFVSNNTFKSHLYKKHKLGPEKSEIIARNISTEQTLRNTISQRIHRRDKMTLWIKQKNIEEMNNKVEEQVGHEDTQMNCTQDNMSSQQESVQSQRITLPPISTIFRHDFNTLEQNESNTPLPKKKRISTECKKCGCKRGNKNCGFCKPCCLHIGGCKIHQNFYNINEDVNAFDVVLADTETTDFKDKSLTDFYAYNKSKESIITFENFIRPRRKIEKRVVELTAISNEMVLNGTREYVALNMISQQLSKKTIIVGHNVAFDRDALYKGIVYWKQKKRIDQFKEQQLIFVDTLPLFKTKLPNLKSHKLGDIYTALFKKEIENQHRAMSDVLALIECLSHPKVLGDNLESGIRNLVSKGEIKANNLMYFDENGYRIGNDQLVESSFLKAIKK